MLLKVKPEINEVSQQIYEEFPNGDKYVDKFAELGQSFAVIKVGGAIIDDPELLRTTVTSLVNLQVLGLSPVVVHGGGQQIDRELAASSQTTDKVNGRRITRQEHMPAVETALLKANVLLSQAIVDQGGDAAGVRGIFAGVLSDPNDLGSTDKITEVDSWGIERLSMRGILPVVSCIGHLATNSSINQPININADMSSGALAAHLGVLKHISLTKEGAIKNGAERIANMTAPQAQALIRRGVINGGMIPKVNEALNLLNEGIHDVVITSPDDLMKELLTDEGAGTLIHVDDGVSSL